MRRKYVLTKIAPGDYLLPSNDGGTIWRISKYEDGPSHGLAEWPKDRELWGVWKWTGRDIYKDPHFDEWDRWEMCGGMCATRKEAIDTALSR